jgi:hypothetical protein
MKTITIHGLDEMLEKRIREKAKDQGFSLNKTIKKLLEKSLGVNQGRKKDHREDFMDLFGVWTENDLNEFNSATSELNQVDPGDWR